MGSKRISLVACAVVMLGIGGSRLFADDQRTNNNQDQKWLGTIATKLGLNQQQREALRKNHEECEKKAGPIEQQIWSQFHAELAAINQQLNEQQQASLKQALKNLRLKELDNMAAKLGLNGEQKQRLQTICNDFEAKFEQLAANRDQGEKAHQQFRDLRQEFIAAVRPELNPEQQSKLPFVMEEEHLRWRDPAVRRAHLKAVLDQLDISAAKKEQIKQVDATHEKQIQPLLTQLGQVRKEACDKMESQLTAEQREKFREMKKAYGGEQ